MKLATRLAPARTFALSVVFGLLFPFAFLMGGQDIPAGAAARGVPDDWTHHRLIYANPGTAENAKRSGNYDRWLRIVNNPRFKLQQSKREAAAKASPNRRTTGVPILLRRSEAEETGSEARGRRDSAPMGRGKLPRGLSRASVSAAGHPDGRRFDRGVVGDKHLLRSRIHTDWSENMGSGATAGIGVFPAKYSFAVDTANCGNAAQPDFVVFNTGLTGSGTQASIVSYDNLYSGCPGPSAAVPSVYWAYNTNGGKVVTSVVLSPTGTQVAFAQSSAGVASLVILKWAASATETPGSPATLPVTTADSYRGCSTPCMTALTFSGSADDSGSSAFYDYTPGSDTIYIGDDSGKLHKFTGVFSGTPTEATGAWPIALSSSALDSPVYDSGSGNIFVGDYLLNLSSTCAASGNPCGYLYSVAASSGVVVGTSNRLDYNFGLVDGPLIDSTAGTAYVFVGSDSNDGPSSPCGANLPCSGVFQFPTNFTAGNGSEATVGPGYEFLLAGTFDNAYFTSSSLASPTGHLYVVGNTGPANNTLYQLTINANVLSATAVAGPVLSDSYSNGFYAAGLQVSEIYNNTTDLIFLSVLSYGAPAACSSSLTNGCVISFDVSSGSISGGTAPSAARAEAGGTSGIVVDNAASLAGASNIYFTPLANQACTTSGSTGGCAIQTLQSDLM